MSNKIILTYGTFDLFHIGHVRLLKRLSELGDKLYVGLSTDDFNCVKGKSSFFSYEERKEILESSRYVDKVFSENCWSQKKQDILKYNVDIFAIGDDWEGEFDDLKKFCEVHYLPRTKNISTTQIKSSLENISSSDIHKLEGELKKVLSIVETLSSGVGSNNDK